MVKAMVMAVPAGEVRQMSSWRECSVEEACAELLEVDELIDIPIYNERKNDVSCCRPFFFLFWYSRTTVSLVRNVE